MQIMSQYICAWLRSQTIDYNSTNNCSKKYQLPNHDLSSLLQLKQQYIYSKSVNKFSISFKQHANHVTIYLRMITLSNNRVQFNKQLFKEISTTKPRSCKSHTNQTALYLLQITQLVQHFHSNSMQILSQFICA